MKVAVFTSQFPGLVNTFFARDMRALIDAGIEVEVFPLYPLDPQLWPHVPDCLGEGVLPRTRVHHLTRAAAFRQLTHVPMRYLTSLLREMSSIGLSAARYGPEALVKSGYAAVVAAAWAHTKDHGFDHVLAYWGNYASTAAYLFHRLVDRCVPYTTFLHAGTDLYRTPTFLKQKLLHADRIIVVCEFNRRYLRDHYPAIYEQIARKITVHHLGLELGAFPFQPQGRPAARALAVGWFGRNKGFDQLLRAAQLVTARGSALEIELVGEGPEREALARLARTLGLDDRVRFRGWLRFPDVRQAMLDATMLVHPSIGLGDAVPTVIKEAMALGTPVVASNVAGIPELLAAGECGVLVPPQDVEALARGIERLLHAPADRQRFAAAARGHVERTFDLAKNGPRLAGLLRATHRPLIVESSEHAFEI